MGKNEPLTEEQRMESSSYDDDIKQSLLYWKIANATGISIDDRCIYLLKRGMTEKDIDVMLSILKEEQRVKRRSRNNEVHSSFKINVGRSKKLSPHVPGQKEKRREQRQVPGPNKYGYADSTLTKKKQIAFPWGIKKHVSRKIEQMKVNIGPGAYDVNKTTLSKQGGGISHTGRDVSSNQLMYNGAKKEANYKHYINVCNKINRLGHESPGPAKYLPVPLPSKMNKSFSMPKVGKSLSKKSKRVERAKTPGAIYSPAISMGKQQVSYKRSAPSYKFAPTERRTDEFFKGSSNTPGPSRYNITREKTVNLSQYKRCNSAPLFSNDRRAYYAASIVSEKAKMPAPSDYYIYSNAKTTLGRQVNSNYKNRGGTIFGSGQRYSWLDFPRNST